MSSAAIPPAAPPPPAQTAGSNGPVSVAVVSDAAPVADLPEGTVITAEAAARAVKGTVTLTTPDGATLQVKVQGGAQLPPIAEGAVLLLQVQQAKNGEMLLRLLAINGRALGGATLPQQLQTLQPGVLLPGGADMAGLLSPGKGMAAATPQTAQAMLPGQGSALPLGLTATMIRPAVQPGGTAPTGQPGQFQFGPNGAALPFDLPAGTTFTVRIAGIGTPSAGQPVPQQPGAPDAAATQPGLAGQIAPRPAMGAPGPGGLPQPTPSPIPATPPIPAPPSTPILPGTVIAHPPGGQAVVQTPIGTVSLPTPADMDAGTKVLLDVVGQPVPPQPSARIAAPPLPGLGEGGWPALSQAMDSLSASGQSQALEQLLRNIPQANPRLAASLAAFAGALRNGDAKALVPDSAIRGLEKAGKKEVAERLKGDLEALTEQAGKLVGNGGEWRAYTMPFLGGGIVDPIRLFVRRGDAEDKSRPGGTGNDQRFVVDLDLSRLGRLQLDGLVRREDKLFDLIIRTREALPEQIRHDILGIFTGSSELLGTKGTVSFQSGGRWVEFPPAPSEPTRLQV